MKKNICLTAMACLLMLIVVTGCAQEKTQPDDGPAPGGYTEDRKLESDDLAIFETATAELLGVTYEPTLVATQVVAGANYRFTATATPTTPDAKAYTVYVYIYQPLDGEPELTEIETIDK